MPSQTFTSTTTWTVPGGVTSVTVECWGGGGGGGYGKSVLVTNPEGTMTEIFVGTGAGGAGGAYAKKEVAVTPGASYTVTVGVGGTRGIANPDFYVSGTPATNGGDSWFGTTGTVIAKGGAYGQSAWGDSATTAGAGTTAGSIGDVVYRGGNGSITTSYYYAGAGGGGAGSTGNGGDASGITAGTGASLYGGNGGTPPYAARPFGATSNGSSGNNYGAGGSGAASTANYTYCNMDGGNGAQGLVILTWVAPPVNNDGNFFLFF